MKVQGVAEIGGHPDREIRGRRRHQRNRGIGHLLALFLVAFAQNLAHGIADYPREIGH